jgi:hypothetical protein
MKGFLTVNELFEAIKNRPSNANVVLQHEGFEAAILAGKVQYEPPTSEGEVGTVVLRIHPHTELSRHIAGLDGVGAWRYVTWSTGGGNLDRYVEVCVGGKWDAHSFGNDMAADVAELKKHGIRQEVDGVR